MLLNLMVNVSALGLEKNTTHRGLKLVMAEPRLVTADPLTAYPEFTVLQT
jgi:hypothetical protein